MHQCYVDVETAAGSRVRVRSTEYAETFPGERPRVACATSSVRYLCAEMCTACSVFLPTTISFPLSIAPT